MPDAAHLSHKDEIPTEFATPLPASYPLYWPLQSELGSFYVTFTCPERTAASAAPSGGKAKSPVEAGLEAKCMK